MKRSYSILGLLDIYCLGMPWGMGSRYRPRIQRGQVITPEVQLVGGTQTSHTHKNKEL